METVRLTLSSKKEVEESNPLGASGRNFLAPLLPSLKKGPTEKCQYFVPNSKASLQIKSSAQSAIFAGFGGEGVGKG